MNKKVLTIFLVLVIIVVGYNTFQSINKEISYREQVKEIDLMVIGRLDTLRKMQLAFRDVNGKYAENFDVLFDFMKNGKYIKLKQIGDNDGEVNNAQVDTLFLSPIVEILGEENINVNINKYKFVPPMDTALFKINAGTISQNNVTVPVFEISDPHPFNKTNKPLKVGDMYNAITSGNWK
ncbi:MAG: hypothetical protein Q8K70_12780 [Bacteroidota bacterium]|nr:hypothetical protein [Bacteroidota bacterium]